MSAIRPILCGVDGSPGSRHAVRTATKLSRELDAPLLLVHVLPPRPSMPLASVPVAGQPVGTAQIAELDREERDAAFESVKGELAGAEADLLTERGFPASRMSAVADAHNARLIVVGTRGTGAARSALVGSVSRDLAADASRPVLVVPERSDGTLAPGPVVCGVDGSQSSRGAARVAASIAEDLAAALTLVFVRSSPRSGESGIDALSAVNGATSAGNHIERVATIGDPAEELARAAGDRNAAVLVVGSRGHGAVRAALLGSVSARVTAHARCPVLIVPPALTAGTPSC